MNSFTPNLNVISLTLVAQMTPSLALRSSSRTDYLWTPLYTLPATWSDTLKVLCCTCRNMFGFVLRATAPYFTVHSAKLSTSPLRNAVKKRVPARKRGMHFRSSCTVMVRSLSHFLLNRPGKARCLYRVKRQPTYLDSR